ncbi:hypothetical protein N9Y42_00010 [Mariniblastus sp.]|nr:hypothetical protein [Mariniblastus sp.]
MIRITIVLCLLSLGCRHQSVSETTFEQPGNSELSFRQHVVRLVSAKRFDDAVSYLKTIDPIEQADADDDGYLAVAEDLIVLPGIYPDIEFDNERDWEFPGTSDVIEHEQWQESATEFATKYNQHVKNRR